MDIRTLSLNEILLVLIKKVYLSLTLKTSNFIKRDTPTQVFSCEFCEIFKNTFFCRTLLVSFFSNRQMQPPQVFYVLCSMCLRPATLLKKGLWHRCFPENFAKFLRTPFLQNNSGRLLLNLTIIKSHNY